MPQILGSRSVLAVCDLALSTKFYIDVLGFTKDAIQSEGWSFLSRDNFRVMLGECVGETPASELGNHSYFVHIAVEGLDQLYEEFRRNGATNMSRPEDKPWGLQEFRVQTPDGHRIVFGERLSKH
jgi:uncharacterized glyoxalase superfamily protein PhnB